VKKSVVGSGGRCNAQFVGNSHTITKFWFESNGGISFQFELSEKFITDLKVALDSKEVGKWFVAADSFSIATITCLTEGVEVKLLKTHSIETDPVIITFDHKQLWKVRVLIYYPEVPPG
jgi:hypothetical protein